MLYIVFILLRDVYTKTKFQYKEILVKTALLNFAKQVCH